jgi:flagellar motor switch protein FliG
MEFNSDNLRRVVVVLSSLPTAEADKVLAQFDAADSELLRQSMNSIDQLDENEQHDVLTDFLAQQGTGEIWTDQAATPDLAQTPPDLPPSTPNMPHAAPAEPEQTPAAAPPTARPAEPAGRFAMLEQLPASLVASQLTNEHPQTVAVLLSRLQPGSSAGILREMSPALQTELLQRISSLGAVSEQVIMELEQAVVELVSGENGDQPNGVQGLATVQAILNATDPLHRHQLIDKLGGRYETDSIPQDPPVVDTAAPTPWLEQDVAGVSKVSTTDSGKFVIRFEDLAQLDDTSLATVIQSVDSQLVLLALAGASQDFVQRIMQPLDEHEGKLLQRRMQQIGPVQLQDIARAQQLLASQAIRLAIEGRITIANRRRFVMAA